MHLATVRLFNRISLRARKGVFVIAHPDDEHLPAPATNLEEMPSGIIRSQNAEDSPAETKPPRPSSSSGTAQAFVSLLMLIALLLSARFLVPSVVEEIRYAWHRGELRAEYESSGEGLRNVSLDSLAQAYQMVNQRVGPSVVHIDVERSMSPEELQLANAIKKGTGMELSGDQGSGVIVDELGYIVTNYHVVEGGTAWSVGLSDGRRVPASVIGLDALSDLAVLKIDAPHLFPAGWGDSDEAEVGTPVWAVGSPFGLDRTVTFGILSGKHRAAKAGTRYQDFMQSDVAVNPGNSGGPLIDSSGKIIGINTAIVGDTYRGVSFSIPSNVARDVYQRLREKGRMFRGWLGVALAEVPRETRDLDNLPVRGAFVSGLAAGDSPARSAGILAEDIIIRFDGQDVGDMGELMRMVGDTPSGSSVRMDVLRNLEPMTLDVEIGLRPERM